MLRSGIYFLVFICVVSKVYQAYLFKFFIKFQISHIKIHYIVISSNEKVSKTTFKIYYDKNNNTVLNTDLILLVDVEKMVSTVKISVPENKKDKSFRKEVFKTSIDMDKLFNGVQGTYFAKVLLENYFTSINFEPKFPLKKVRIHVTKYQPNNFSILLLRVSIR